MTTSMLRLVSALAAWVFLVATPVAAQVNPDDVDGDGVADAIDQCLDTPPLDLVDPTGCSVCPCDSTPDGASWASHEDYVACVTVEARARHGAHTMKRREMKAAIKRARKASCGSAELTRCCVYFHLDDTATVNVGQCRVITPDACTALGDHADWVDDIAAGSCTPNPCQF